MFASENLRVASYAAGTLMRPHVHEAASLNFVLTGEFREHIRGAERAYVAGHVAFCPPGTAHSQHFGARGVRQLIVTPPPEWLSYLRECRLQLEQAPFARPAQTLELGRRLQAELASGDQFSGLACEGLLLEMVAAFGREHGRGRPARPPAWLEAARAYIEAHACRPLRLAGVAQAAGRHEIHLAREFRRYFGVSMGAYQRRLRSERAAQLLLQTGAQVTAVALECGFANHAHLCRVFRACFGVSPTQYRSLARPRSRQPPY